MIVVLARRLAVSGALGAAVAFCIRGDWRLGFAALGVALLVPAGWWVCGEVAWVTATVAMLREVPPPEPEPVPRPGDPGRPPWDTAPMPRWMAPPAERSGDGAPGRHRKRRELREAAAAAVRAAARVPLP
jgi:hypothetical protein